MFSSGDKINVDLVQRLMEILMAEKKELSREDAEFMKAWEEGEQYLKDNPEVLEDIKRENRKLDEALANDGLEDDIWED
jgi:hypothetical protein